MTVNATLAAYLEDADLQGASATERARRAIWAFANIRAAFATVAAIIAAAEASYRENEVVGWIDNPSRDSSAAASIWAAEPIGHLPVDETHARTAAGMAWQ